jgi:hypothetical protein
MASRQLFIAEGVVGGVSWQGSPDIKDDRVGSR